MCKAIQIVNSKVRAVSRLPQSSNIFEFIIEGLLGVEWVILGGKTA